ncbi:MAG: TIGR04552 family protein [Bdellovibrionales bacterium]
MAFDLQFASQVLDSVVGGRSSVDIARLDVKDLEQAYEFSKTYGYDLNKPTDLDSVWELHKNSISLLRDRLLDPGEAIPDILADSTKLKDPAYLLIFASTPEHKNNDMQLWSCAILRVMHVLAHIGDDLHLIFSDKIMQTVFGPFQAHIHNDPVSGITLGLKNDVEQIKLVRFDLKTTKSVASSAIKLLTKKEATASSIYDKIGVRFVTKSIFDAFRVVRFLVDEHIISFPNIMPDQARNTLFPANLFLESMKELKEQKMFATGEEIEAWLNKKLSDSVERAEYKERQNDFSGQNFRAIKFIARQMVEVEAGGKQFRFFCPYEVQVMDYETYLKNISGPEAHELYKRRQRQAARRRVLGHLFPELA